MEIKGRLLIGMAEGSEKEFELSKSSVVIGRGELSDVVIRDGRVSRAHLRLEFDEGAWYLVDLGSSNGTLLNGERVEKAKLSPGDVITIGSSDLKFSAEAEEPEPELTMITTIADLESTLARDTIAMTINETRNPRLVVHSADRTWEVPLVADTLTIGRHPDCEIQLPYPDVSRRHARLERTETGYLLSDLGSGNGTWLGKQAVDQHQLADGDAFHIGEATLVFKGGFTVSDLTMFEMPMEASRRRRTRVVVIPGIMGTELWLGGEKIWPNAKILFTHPEIVQLGDRDDIEPGEIVHDVVIVPNFIKSEQYSRLGDYLEEGLGYQRGVDLLEFGYDWRQDVRQSARRLAETLSTWAGNEPVILIAHSLGCLVSRYYVERLDGKQQVERLILLGGPHLGVPKAVTTLVHGPNLLPFGMLGNRLREVIATFPSAYQILPTRPCVVDQDGRQINVLEEETWLPEKGRPLLRQARLFRQELGSRSSVPSISIFGYGIETINLLRVERNTDGSWRKIGVEKEPKGDATVPEWSTVLKGSEIHPVQQYHGSLYVDSDVKMRLKLELTKKMLQA